MKRLLPALSIVIALTAAARAQSITLEDGFAPVVDKVLPTVVRIEVDGERLGSGVIVTDDGVIITNNHVVEEAGEIDVVLHDKRRLEARLIGNDPETDIAVIQVPAKGLPHATFADSSKARVGEFALAIGSPLGLDESVSLGIVSAVGRRNNFQEFIQTDAAVNHGNSGGPLVNARGEVIGINSMILSRSGENNGIALAVSSNLAKSIMTQLRDKGHVNRGFLGVGFGQSKKGILVAEVVARSPAALAGLRPGDLVLALDGKPYEDWQELRLAIAGHEPGTKIKLNVLRNGKKRDLEATLISRE